MSNDTGLQEFYKSDMDFIKKVYESIDQHAKEAGNIDQVVVNLSRAFTYAMFSLADRESPKNFDRDAALIISQIDKGKCDQIAEEMDLHSFWFNKNKKEACNE